MQEAGIEGTQPYFVLDQLFSDGRIRVRGLVELGFNDEQDQEGSYEGQALTEGIAG